VRRLQVDQAVGTCALHDVWVEYWYEPDGVIVRTFAGLLFIPAQVVWAHSAHEWRDMLRYRLRPRRVRPGG
jgi:hypothetical protein